MADIDALRRENSLSSLATGFGLKLQKNANEFEACCPFHSEKTPSFTIYRGRDAVERFHCFGCGESGDVVDFVKSIKGCDTKDAIEILGGRASRPNVAPKQMAAPIDVYAGIELLVPKSGIRAGSPVRLWNPKREKWGEITPSMVFPYFRSDGSPLGYVLRHDMSNGEKETPMVCRVRLPSGDECWSRFPFPRPRPLYRSEKLIDGQVIVVEGEKCADAMADASGRQCVTWAGGTFGVHHTDWSPLAGRSVVIWPDADDPGRGTADEIASILTGLDCRVKILNVHAAVAA